MANNRKRIPRHLPPTTPEESAAIDRDLAFYNELWEQGIHDDVKGRGDAHEQITLGLENEEHRLYLNSRNAAALRAILAPYLEVARPIDRPEDIAQPPGDLRP